MSPDAFLRLHPIRPARVSEISETTATASVPKEQRINFHIGHPIQDDRLSSLFLRIALGVDIRRQDLTDSNPDAFLDLLNWDPGARPILDFLIRLIRKSTPYLPRGGYLRTDPHALIGFLCSHLENQQEPLHYDLGRESGRREVILASGGVIEALRVTLFALSTYLVHRPAVILPYRYDLPTHFRTIPHLEWEILTTEERPAREQMETLLRQSPLRPYFLIIGDLLTEETRRRLRSLALEYPLFFIEVNDAPNHLSLAREAGLVQRVIRILTPAIFSPRLKHLSTVFLLGNADYLNAIENVHFNLKGTPSASEVELLIFLLEQQRLYTDRAQPAFVNGFRPAFEGLGLRLEAENTLYRVTERAEKWLEASIERHTHHLDQVVQRVEQKSHCLLQRLSGLQRLAILDEFSSLSAREMVETLIEHLDDPPWLAALQRSFLSAFLKHQPQYRPEACVVVSGSSRTALGILGFHCGIEEVIIPDLSWSYEQCFPRVHAVPLTPSLQIDGDAMLARLDDLCRQDPFWPQHGAVVINNPHNATGRIFDETAVRRLIQACLQRGITVIDDLSYQNVAPVDDLPLIKTARQIASELVNEGQITSEQIDRVITVHALSKTDCLAGARLAVVEIGDPLLRERFLQVNATIQPNLAAILLVYLFYRGSPEGPRAYWRLRNALFRERTQALLTALENLPPERNPFGLTILPQMGSMYPLLTIQRLPNGLSLDWLASSLARTGIGMLPLAAFARTEAGFEIARATFRLTLGGEDGAAILLAKTRRLLIDLNRLIADTQARYNLTRPTFHLQTSPALPSELERAWHALERDLTQRAERLAAQLPWRDHTALELPALQNDFLRRYLPERLAVFRQRLGERAFLEEERLRRARSDGGRWLTARLEREFMKDSLDRRRRAFLTRTHDRTVHPTQMYSIQVETALDDLIESLLDGQRPSASRLDLAAHHLWEEFLGRNVPISSQQEGLEMVLDLDALTAAEDYAELFSPDATFPAFLSFWSDWDGSNRPSGQGHLLLAAIVMENVRRMAHILTRLRQVAPQSEISPSLLDELERLPERNQRFTRLLNDITLLTHQLEQRYRSILPFSMPAHPWQRLAARLHLRGDLNRQIWEHNDRYERRMLDLRRQRRAMLEDYLALNKRLRKQLYALIPVIRDHLDSDPLLRTVTRYRDLLQRMVITPRIHQGMITARDPFAIDTTVYNLHEINFIAGKYGNPGATLALQISLSTKPEALIALDRKMRMQREARLREEPSVELPPIWLIPLFEDETTVQSLPSYLDALWEYALQSRTTSQTPQQRFAEILPEIFIAGSDLSQQVSQAASAALYARAKYDLHSWLAHHGLTDSVRIKLGSGEAMQRQGGYYSPVAGRPAFLFTAENRRRFAAHLPAAARQSTAYAVTPLQGVFLGRDLRTLQSNISERMRFLPLREYVTLLHHLHQTQDHHRRDLLRAAQMLTQSRLEMHGRSQQELRRLTLEASDPLYDEFLNDLREHFRHILYGRPEDVVGLHVFSYFIARSLPQLRDRPTSRRRAGSGAQILASIAEIIPLSQQGSLLRAIAHNQAQTMVLGINQLTTGLFRALDRYAQRAFSEAERERMIRERILPHLPVYEILHSLRLYQDPTGEFLRRLETALPAGNSALVALREDADAMNHYLPLFQQELLRRHGLDVSDFFTNGTFIPDLLPTLRPDLAVLLQANLFETDLERMLAPVHGKIDETWRAEVNRLLDVRRQIHLWRAHLWELLGDSVYQRVQLFTELASALYAFSSTRSFETPGLPARPTRLPPALSVFFRTTRLDDDLRQFLIGAIEYLNAFTQSSLEMPVSLIRAMNDIECLAQLEESGLPPDRQEAVRCCLLQIARLTGEGG